MCPCFFQVNCIFSFVIVILDSNSCKLQKMFGKVADVKPQVDPQVGGEPVDWHILALAITDIVGSFYSLFLFLCKWLKIHFRKQCFSYSERVFYKAWFIWGLLNLILQ